jgi:hemerythrin-like domain-containing protein
MLKFLFIVFLIPLFLFGEEIEVSTNEDLMREHGILNRILLIYEEMTKRIEMNGEFSFDLFKKTVTLTQDFVENYHEKLEETYIFPKFKNEYLELVQELKEQHQIGRKITQTLLSINENEKEKIAPYLRAYVKMFRPHEAKEDTLIFPAFKKLISRNEYEKLGNTFEEKEESLFGKEGFDKVVKEVGEIEKRLGIYNPSIYNPKNITP